jgi:hypothetical protein
VAAMKKLSKRRSFIFFMCVFCAVSTAQAKLIIDTRLADRGGEGVPKVGEVFTYGLYARIVGTNADASDDGLKIITGSVVSRDVNGGFVRGDITARPLAPFNALGAYAGDRRDMDGDGDIDAGGAYDGTNPIGLGWFAVRSGQVQTASHLDTEFKFAEVTFTVTEVYNDAPVNADTWITFEKRKYIYDGALWITDGRLHSFATDPDSGPSSVVKGSVLADGGLTSDPGGEAFIPPSLRSVVPEPGMLLITTLAALAVASRRYVR